MRRSCLANLASCTARAPTHLLIGQRGADEPAERPSEGHKPRATPSGQGRGRRRGRPGGMSSSEADGARGTDAAIRPPLRATILLYCSSPRHLAPRIPQLLLGLIGRALLLAAHMGDGGGGEGEGQEGERREVGRERDRGKEGGRGTERVREIYRERWVDRQIEKERGRQTHRHTEPAKEKGKGQES